MGVSTNFEPTGDVTRPYGDAVKDLGTCFSRFRTYVSCFSTRGKTTVPPDAVDCV